MKKHRPFILLITFFILLSLCSCGKLPTFGAESDTDSPQAPPEYDGVLSFEGRRYTYSGTPGDIFADGDRLIIKECGKYLLLGELSEGRIAVECVGEVTLCLGGVSVSSSLGAPIEHRGRGGLVLESLSGTVNYLSAPGYTGGILPTGGISAEGNICFSGEGSIVISSDCDSAVVSGGGIYIEGGGLTVSSKGFGLWAKDRIKISGGSLQLTYAETGLFAFGGEYSRGLVEILGGSIVAICKDTAIFAEREIKISGGRGDIRARTVYKCQRSSHGKTEEGVVTVDAEGFPPYEKNDKMTK